MTFIADALKAVVDAAIRHLDDDLLDRLREIGRIDALGRAKLPRHSEFLGVGVDADDAGCPLHLRSLNYGHANGAEAKHGNRRADFDLCGVVHGAHAGGNRTAHQG